VRTPLLLLVAALSAAAQPKKLVNAQLDTRSAQSGLESVFRTLTTAQPQPAWIAYTVPAARGRYFGCDSYWRDGEFIVAGRMPARWAGSVPWRRIATSMPAACRSTG